MGGLGYTRDPEGSLAFQGGRVWLVRLSFGVPTWGNSGLRV